MKKYLYNGRVVEQYEEKSVTAAGVVYAEVTAADGVRWVKKSELRPYDGGTAYCAGDIAVMVACAIIALLAAWRVI